MSEETTATDQKEEKAEVKVETAMPKYWDAPEVKETATKFVQANCFNFPTNTPILYVFIDKAKSYWGKCSHCSELFKFASGYEFSIVINHDRWQVLTETQREALVWHELEHVGYDAEKDKYYIVDHDLEEFGRVVAKYGLWRDSVLEFANVTMKAISLPPRKE